MGDGRLEELLNTTERDIGRHPIIASIFALSLSSSFSTSLSPSRRCHPVPRGGGRAAVRALRSGIY